MSWGYDSDMVASHNLASARAASAADQARTDVKLLAAQVDYLQMVVEALWTIIAEKHGLTIEELVKRIEQIDLRDGKLDGKNPRAEAPLCPDCGRTIMRRRQHCQYCGTAVIVNPFQR